MLHDYAKCLTDVEIDIVRNHWKPETLSSYWFPVIYSEIKVQSSVICQIHKHALLELVTSEIFYRSNSAPLFAISGFNLTADEPRILSGYLVLEWRLETNEGRVKWRLLGSFGAVIHAVL